MKSQIKNSFNLPLNFDENEVRTRFIKYENLTLPRIYPKVFRLKNVRISNNSVIFRFFKILRRSCIGEVIYNKYKNGFGFYLKFIIPRLTFKPKKFILITDEWTSNYYHWHIYSLIRLKKIFEKGVDKNFQLFLPSRYKKYAFVAPSLKKFGIDESKIFYLPKKSHIKAEEIISCAIRGNLSGEISSIRNTLRNQNEPTQRIYISREKQVLRFIENEDEVTETLEEFGFKKVIAEHLSYDEQLDLFSKTKYLVGPHGAGLTNMIFMKDGTNVLEFANDLPTYDYFGLSNSLGINYMYQFCEYGPNSKVKDPHHGSLIVDISKLRKNLAIILKNDRTN